MLKILLVFYLSVAAYFIQDMMRFPESNEEKLWLPFIYGFGWPIIFAVGGIALILDNFKYFLKNLLNKQ